MVDKSFNYYRIEKAISYLVENYKLQPSLDNISKHVCISPIHFQKIFTDWVGISPKKFVQYLTISHLKENIKETENMLHATAVAGLSSQSRLHDLFVSIEGMTPLQYKQEGKNLEIYYGYHPSPFGLCFIAVTNNKVCYLKFIDEERTRNEFDEFAEYWSAAKIINKPNITQHFVNKIFQPEKVNIEKLELLVRGSEFQLKVWDALLKIPFGRVCSYQTIASIINKENATRTVATAVGQNPISYLIPCHRILTKEGTLGNFHYGKVRKQSMLGWELAINDQ